MSKFFISLAGSQLDFAQKVDSYLQGMGHTTILYKRDFGKTYKDFVLDMAHSLHGCDHTLCLISGDFLNSGWCMKELNVAYKMGKLIPVLHEDCDLSYLPEIPTCIDVRNLSEDEAFEKLAFELPEFLACRPDLQQLSLETKTAQINEIVVLLAPVQDPLSPVLTNILGDSTVSLIELEQVVTSENEAETLLLRHGADLIVWQNLHEAGLDVYQKGRRGWELPIGPVTVPGLIGGNLTIPLLADTDSSWVVLNALGMLQLARNNDAVALDLFWKSTTLFPSPELMIKSFISAGDVYFKHGMMDKALSCYDRAIDIYSETDIDPNEMVTKTHEAEAVLSERLGIEIKLDLTGLKPNSGVYFSRGKTYQHLGKEVEALRDFSKAIELDPSWSDPYCFRAMIFKRQDMYLESVADLLHWSALVNTHDVELLVQLLTREMEMDARDDLEKLRNIEPTRENLDAYFDRAYLHRALGENLQALADYNVCILLDPENYLYYFQRSEVNLRLGNVKEATLDYNRFVQLSNEGDTTSE